MSFREEITFEDFISLDGLMSFGDKVCIANGISLDR